LRPVRAHTKPLYCTGLWRRKHGESRIVRNGDLVPPEQAPPGQLPNGRSHRQQRSCGNAHRSPCSMAAQGRPSDPRPGRGQPRFEGRRPCTMGSRVSVSGLGLPSQDPPLTRHETRHVCMERCIGFARLRGTDPRRPEPFLISVSRTHPSPIHPASGGPTHRARPHGPCPSPLTTPRVPSTVTTMPSRDRIVLSPVPTTAGMPYSRATGDAWAMRLPVSVTTAAARAALRRTGARLPGPCHFVPWRSARGLRR